VLNFEVLISEFVAIDGKATSTISSSEITTLGHEAINDSVDGTALVVVFVFVVTTAQGSEVFCRFGSVICIKLNQILVLENKLTSKEIWPMYCPWRVKSMKTTGLVAFLLANKRLD
jgi:hypothetical protein